MLLSRPTIELALRRLGEKASERELRGEMTIYGGVVMMMAYDARAATKDVDAVFRPREELLDLAREVAVELGLPDSWLNDDVRQFLGNLEAKSRWLELDLPGLSIHRPTARYLLAMKARAARLSIPGGGGDFDDLVFLLRHCRVCTLDQVESVVARFFPGDALPDRHREVVQMALAKAHGRAD